MSNGGGRLQADSAASQKEGDSHKKGWNFAIATTCVDLEGTALSEISYTEKDKYYIVSLTVESKKYETNEQI